MTLTYTNIINPQSHPFFGQAQVPAVPPRCRSTEGGGQHSHTLPFRLLLEVVLSAIHSDDQIAESIHSHQHGECSVEFPRYPDTTINEANMCCRGRCKNAEDLEKQHGTKQHMSFNEFEIVELTTQCKKVYFLPCSWLGLHMFNWSITCTFTSVAFGPRRRLWSFSLWCFPWLLRTSSIWLDRWGLLVQTKLLHQNRWFHYPWL